MNKKEAKERIAQLKKTIQHHRYLYHVKDTQEISDAALDSLKKELFDLEQQYPDLVTPDSPTQRIGGKPLKEFEKVAHEKRMLSFNDAFSEEDMREWVARIEKYLGRPLTKTGDTFYCELKIDGLAIELVYNDGIFIQGSTRGDGTVGEDVTNNLKTVDAIPLKLRDAPPKHVVARGEVFITKKEFERVNKEQKKKGEKPYANPRNIAAGSIRQLDPKVTATRSLDSFAYGLVTDLGQKKHEEEHALLERFGLKTNVHNKSVATLEAVFAFHKEWEKKREQLDYEVDGIVVIVNDEKTFADAGVVGKAPRAAIAYKFAAREATTIVEDIKVQVGRTGALTPVAVLKPVQVGGVTIAHATLHNYDEIQRLGIKIGDTVVVSRAGDVIPQITNVLKDMRSGKEKEFHMPKKCPVDGSPVEKEGVIYRCTNPKCGARHREGLYHFVSRGAFNIEGLGPKIIDRFIDEGLVSDAADIFTLENQQGDIAALERFGKLSAKNIAEEVGARKNIPLPRFIYALGIMHVGEETARLLAQKAADMKKVRVPTDLLKTIGTLSPDELQEIPDIGPAVAESIKEYFGDAQHQALIKKFEKVGVTLEAKGVEPKSQKLKGKTFVLTGALESITRDEAKAKIRAHGGEVSGSVSKKTDYVIAGEDPGGKYDDAKKLGITIISEKEFKKMLQ